MALNKSQNKNYIVFACSLLMLWNIIIVCSCGKSSVKSIPSMCARAGEIALTFDEGPSYYTGMLLNILGKENVKAAFHVSTEYLENPVILAYLKRAVQDGHLIGLFVKPSESNPGETDPIELVKKMSHKMQKYIGYKPIYVRFPFPGVSKQVLEKFKQSGYIVTTFNLDSQDYTFQGKGGAENVLHVFQEMIERIVPPAKGSFIMVQRDMLGHSVNATEGIIKYAKKNGYSFVRLDGCVWNHQKAKLPRPSHSTNQNSTNDRTALAQSSSTQIYNSSPTFLSNAMLVWTIMLMVIVVIFE